MCGTCIFECPYCREVETVLDSLPSEFRVSTGTPLLICPVFVLTVGYQTTGVSDSRLSELVVLFLKPAK